MTLDSIQTEFFLQQQLSDSRYSISKVFENCLIWLAFSQVSINLVECYLFAMRCPLYLGT